MEEKNMAVGTQAIDFTFDTLKEKNVKLYDKLKEANKTYLIFLRYYGCTACQLDIMELIDEYHRFVEKNAQVLLVLQSTPESILAQHKGPEIPFTIVCDPDQKIYKLYQLPAAQSKEELLPADQMDNFMQKVARCQARGLEHGTYEGEELQLPAAFLLDQNGKVLYAKRAKSLIDMPTIDEVAQML